MRTVRKKILVISPIPTHPRNAGHRERIYQLLRQMQALGHDVHLLHVTLERDGDVEAMRACWGDRLHIFQHDIARTPYRCSPSFHGTFFGKLARRAMFAFGYEYTFPYAIDDWYDPECEHAIAQLQERFRFEVALAEYVFFSRVLTLFDAQTRKIIDTHDVFGNRQKLFQQHGQAPVWFYTTRRQERRGLRRADIILAIQEEERHYFAALLPEKQVVTVGHFAQLSPLPFRAEEPPTLLFFASSNPVNLHGLQAFLQGSWPIIRKQAPNVCLLIAGSICQALPDDEAYQKIGTVETAQDAYMQADVVINPMLFGTGVKIKNIEAMGYAKALVTTPAGAKGLEDGQQTAFFAANMPDEFAQRVIELLSNHALRHKMSGDAYQYVFALQQQHSARLAEVLLHKPNIYRREH